MIFWPYGLEHLIKYITALAFCVSLEFHGCDKSLNTLVWWELLIALVIITEIIIITRFININIMDSKLEGVIKEPFYQICACTCLSIILYIYFLSAFQINIILVMHN